VSGRHAVARNLGIAALDIRPGADVVKRRSHIVASQ
jgi:hypothetical protein